MAACAYVYAHSPQLEKQLLKEWGGLPATPVGSFGTLIGRIVERSIDRPRFLSAAAGTAGTDPPPAAGAPPEPRGGGLWRGLDPYGIAAISIFLSIFFICWRARLDVHEMIYFIGARRIADPGFLAVDFTWSHLPPTSALFDHLMAPLWSFFGEYSVAIGRLVYWALLGWSIAFLGRTLRLPAWSLFAGFTIWLLWGQTLASCGLPIEGFQVKSFSYPLMLFAVAFAMRGQVARAGLAAGLGTAFHIIVGGWGCLALFLSMLFNREQFSRRQLGIFLLSTAPFIVPLLIGVALFQAGDISRVDQTRRDVIYVAFAMPHCCDYDYFMSSERWIRAGMVFAMALILIFAWPQQRAAKILGAFIGALVLFFLVGELAQRLRVYGLLKLYPGQLAKSLPPLFLFIFIAGWIGAGGALRRLGIIVCSLVFIATLWLMYNREVFFVLLDTPQDFVSQVWRRHWPRPRDNEPLYAWIRTNTPRNSVFITPFLRDFWSYAERAQVASMQHPPLDRRIIEWKARLEALNHFRRYPWRGFPLVDILDVNERRLSIAELIRIRDLYGATHYLAVGERRDLADHFLHSANGYSVYDITGLAPRAAGGGGSSPSSRTLDAERP